MLAVGLADVAGHFQQHAAEAELLQRGFEFLRFGHQLGLIFGQRDDRGFDGAEVGLELEHQPRALTILGIGQGFFRVGLIQHGEHGALHAGTGFDHKGHDPAGWLAFFNDLHGQAAVAVRVLVHFGGEVQFGLLFGVIAEVIVRAVGDAFDFIVAVGVAVFQVIRAFGIVREVFLRHILHLNFFTRDADGFPPCEAVF